MKCQGANAGHVRCRRGTGRVPGIGRIRPIYGGLIMRMRRVVSTLLASMLVAGTASLLGGAGIASASPGAPGRFTCAGTPKAPGVLTGTYSSVTVRGLCEVSAGAAYVQGSVVVSPHGALVAAFARHNSNLTVGGSLTVLKGATLILGCEAAHFACVDDPNQKSPTLSSSSLVAGNRLARDALRGRARSPRPRQRHRRERSPERRRRRAQLPPVGDIRRIQVAGLQRLRG